MCKPITELLYVPPEERFLKKILSLPPVTIVLDLEDGTPQDKKIEARKNACDFLDAYGKDLHDRIFIRINTDSWREYNADISTLSGKTFRGYVLPKISFPGYLRNIIQSISTERENKLDIIPTIEDAEGVMNAKDILTSSTNICAVQFGAEDFMDDMDTYLLQNAETRIPRMLVSMAARACRIPAIDSPWPGLVPDRKMYGYYADSAGMGYKGCALIHPDQITPAITAYGPEAKREKASLVSHSGKKMTGNDKTMYGPPAKKALVRWKNETNKEE